MAERVMLVCDVCGKPAVQSVTFRVGSRNLAQDLCATHLQELVRASHTPRRGRRSSMPSASAPAPAPAKTTRRPRAAKATASANPATAKRPRKKITDPAVLEKRREALAKARKALAAKRSSAKKAG